MIFLILGIYFICLTSATELDLSQYPLKYVFEIVRHGARAPLMEDPRFTTVGAGQLTPMGMRQRYLLGRYNYQRYQQRLGLDMSISKNGPFWGESTDVNRTI